jgi:D-serine dehydratase
MEWILAKTRGILIEGSSVTSVVGPSEVLYAGDLGEGRQDTSVSCCYGLLWAVAGLVVVVALYECN